MNAPSNNKNDENKLHTFEEVRERYYVYITKKESRDLVERAFLFAKKAHECQFRRSGEPYYHHLLEVVYILTSLSCGPSTLAAAFLHDVVEDTPVTLDEIEANFGKDVTLIVDSLTKIQRLKLSHRQEDDFVAEDHRKIFLGMAKDVRVILIKLADRLHNLRTLDALSKVRQQVIAKETLDVFAPIAHRLGINTIKSELEDLSLKYLHPEIYNDLLQTLNQRTKNRTKSLEGLKKRIADILFEHNIPFTMESRVKSIYSIYRKIYEKGHNIDEIYDLLAIRVITKTELNCYEILGLIHATYKPIPGRFKDYIAVPKPNMYQSLHTCIISGDGNIFEIQIRTEEMDEVAETGIAAHWRYKEGSNYNAKQEQKEIEEQLHWFRDLVNISEEDYNAKDYMSSLTHDIFEANVYVFTPRGKVIDLPNGSTPLDFAYKIHTGVGDSAIGALINNQLVPLNTTLKTGDVVEIKTSKNSPGPNEGWLKIAKTNFARSHIRKVIAKKNAALMKDENLVKGKEACLETFKACGKTETEMNSYLSDANLLSNFHVKDLEELYLAVARKGITPGAIVDFLKLKRVKENKISLMKVDSNPSCPVYVKNAGRIMITLGSCCTPIPGDDIVGYITKGKGVTVHRKNCPNIQESQRLIEVYWKEDLGLATYPVDIKIEANDRANLLVDIMGLFSQHKIPVTSISAKMHPNTMTSTISATIYVSDAKVLTDIFNVITNVTGVYEVARVIH